MKYVRFLIMGLTALTTVLMIPIAVVVHGYNSAKDFVDLSVDRALDSMEKKQRANQNDQ